MHTPLHTLPRTLSLFKARGSNCVFSSRVKPLLPHASPCASRTNVAREDTGHFSCLGRCVTWQDHLRQLGFNIVGDRLYFIEVLTQLYDDIVNWSASLGIQLATHPVPPLRKLGLSLQVRSKRRYVSPCTWCTLGPTQVKNMLRCHPQLSGALQSCLPTLLNVCVCATSLNH